MIALVVSALHLLDALLVAVGGWLAPVGAAIVTALLAVADALGVGS